MYLSGKLKEARIERNLTQKELAKLLTDNGCKTSHATISNWELDISRPDVDTLALICKILNKDGNYFFDNSINETDIRYAEYNGLNTDGLTKEDIEEIKAYIEMRRNINKNKKQ